MTTPSTPTPDPQSPFTLISTNVMLVVGAEIIDKQEADRLISKIVSTRAQYSGRDLYYLVDVNNLKKITVGALLHIFHRMLFQPATYGKNAFFGHSPALSWITKVVIFFGQGRPGKQRRRFRFFPTREAAEAWLAEKN